MTERVFTIVNDSFSWYLRIWFQTEFLLEFRIQTKTHKWEFHMHGRKRFYEKFNGAREGDIMITMEYLRFLTILYSNISWKNDSHWCSPSPSHSTLTGHLISKLSIMQMMLPQRIKRNGEQSRGENVKQWNQHFCSIVTIFLASTSLDSILEISSFRHLPGLCPMMAIMRSASLNA